MVWCMMQGTPKEETREEHLIDEWPATALSGNDILSSCLYTIGTPLAITFLLRLLDRQE